MATVTRTQPKARQSQSETEGTTSAVKQAGAVRPIHAPETGGAAFSAAPRIGLGASVQTKVVIGQPDDPYEREADAVANRVSSGLPAPPISTLPAGGLAQRQSEDDEVLQTSPIQRQIDEDEDAVQTLTIQRQTDENDEEPLQMLPVQRQEEEEVQLNEAGGGAVPGPAASSGSSMSRAASNAIQQRGPGMPLHPTTRGKLESSLSADLNDVRIHNDSRAQQTSKQLRARAFTHGNHIWLGAGESQNDTRLMAHEATHVLQQGGMVRRQPLDDEERPEDSALSGVSSTNGTATTGTALTSEAVADSATGLSAGAILAPPLGAPETAAPDTTPVLAPEDSPEEAVAEAVVEEVSETDGAAEGEAVPEAGAAAPAEAAGGSEVELLMPEPPEGLSEAEEARLAGVQSRVTSTGRANEEMPPSESHVSEARGAVEEPAEETQARAEGALVAALEQRPEPSPEIEELCERIYNIIRSKRPPDEDSLVEADPQDMAREAGGQLDSAVQGDVNRVEGEYAQLQEDQAGTPQQLPQEMATVPESVAGPAINATSATPTGVSEEDVSLDADVEASQQRLDEAGMTSETAQHIQDPSNPVVQARETQGELEETAARDPAEVMAEQQTALANASADMAALQARALESLQNSRSTTVQGTQGQQLEMIGSEEEMRTQVSARAQEIVRQTRTDVQNLLRPLPDTARQRWESGVAILSTEFEQDLARVKSWIDERHSGVGGAVLGVWDAVTGLPDWVTDEYDEAEQAFGDGVCRLLREISTEVNGVIAAAEALIASADEEVAELFDNLPDELQGWAEGERERVQGQLNELHDEVQETQSNINRELTDSASGAVQQVRERIHQLRQEAGGLLGKLADMVNQFLEDPIKFIINGLLSLVGIAPASFWALVNRIGEVIGDIADDPLGFASNLLSAIGQGFQQFFDRFGTHLLSGFWDWLFSGLGSVGVEIPTEFSLKSIITFILQLLGITWERIRRLLAKHIGEENVALIEKAWEIVSTLIELGPEGIFEMIKEQLNPQTILDQILQAAIDYLIETLITQVTVRVAMLFNPVGAVAQAIQAIYKVLKWIFENAARIFSLIETVVNGMADIVAGNIGGMANSVETALAGLISPVIDFIAGLVGLGDLPDKIADTIRGFQEWIEGLLDRVIGWLAERARSLLSALGIGGEEEEEEERLDPTDHQSIVAKAVSELEKPLESDEDYETVRAEKQAQARQIEERYSAILEPGVGLTIQFNDPSADRVDNDLDFKVKVAPNDEVGEGTVPIPDTGQVGIYLHYQHAGSGGFKPPHIVVKTVVDSERSIATELVVVTARLSQLPGGVRRSVRHVHEAFFERRVDANVWQNEFTRNCTSVKNGVTARISTVNRGVSYHEYIPTHRHEAEKAYEYQTGIVNSNVGQYTHSNNCVTHARDVLVQAGIPGAARMPSYEGEFAAQVRAYVEEVISEDFPDWVRLELEAWQADPSLYANIDLYESYFRDYLRENISP